MYIGITGDAGQTPTLHDRYYDYLRERTKQKRAKIAYVLHKYEADLYFCFATITDPNFDLAQLELDLNDALVPPVVVKDFTADVREIVRGIFRANPSTSLHCEDDLVIGLSTPCC